MLRNRRREEEVVLVRLAERSDLPFIGAREGGERLRRELKGTREMKRTVSTRVTFCIPVVRGNGKNLDIGSSPQPAARRAEAWRGVARRAAMEERALMSLLSSCPYKWGRNFPYKEVQLPLN